MKQEISLRIVLENPTPDVDFGVQKGSGAQYETLQKQRSIGTNLLFEFKITLKSETEAPDFSGPFVQGNKGERFVYLDIGTYAGQTDTLWARRLKIPLRDISQEMIAKLTENPNAFLEIKIPGTGKDGGPNCGSLKPFPGWEVIG